MLARGNVKFCATCKRDFNALPDARGEEACGWLKDRDMVGESENKSQVSSDLRHSWADSTREICVCEVCLLEINVYNR